MNKQLGLFAFLWVLISCVVLWAQTSNQVYVYDEKRQLVGVIDEAGNRLAYTYDTVGNLMSVERLTARGPVDIFFVEPNSGRAAVSTQPGTAVTIHGVGFSAVPTQNQVTFNGVAAVVDASTTTMIRTTVPARATTGPVRVTSPLGMGVSRNDFVVVPAVTVTVSPETAAVGVQQTQPFKATLMRGDTVIAGDVFWNVNGLPGGSPVVGTIDTDGVYTAPESLPYVSQVTVTATSVDEPTASGNAIVDIIPRLLPIYTPGASYRVIRPDQIALLPIYTPGASYRVVRPDQIALLPIYTPGASYRVVRPDQIALLPIYTPGASYRVVRPEQIALAPVYAPGASYSNIAVNMLTPARVTRGAMDVAFTVTGRNVDIATALDFLLPGGASDGNITAGDLTISEDGTQITTRISVAAAAGTGARTVVVRTRVGSSVTTATASNQLIVE